MKALDNPKTYPGKVLRFLFIFLVVLISLTAIGAAYLLFALLAEANPILAMLLGGSLAITVTLWDRLNSLFFSPPVEEV